MGEIKLYSIVCKTLMYTVMVLHHGLASEWDVIMYLICLLFYQLTAAGIITDNDACMIVQIIYVNS